MEIPKNGVLEYSLEVYEDLKRSCNLDKPGQYEQAIAILEHWAKKQEHFKKKEFRRNYYAVQLLAKDGSVEKAKALIDTICTLRTLSPKFFDIIDLTPYKDLMKSTGVYILPKITEDQCRIYYMKVPRAAFNTEQVTFFYKYLIHISEYLKTRDYIIKYHIVQDLRGVNMSEHISSINPVELHQAYSIIKKGYGVRVKGIHIISESKLASAFTAILKAVVSEKMASRIHIHPNLESLFEILPKDLFSVDLGGKGKPLDEALEDWTTALTSEDHTKFMTEMFEATIDESKRSTDKFNEEYLGMPGSFKTLNVD